MDKLRKWHPPPSRCRGALFEGIRHRQRNRCQTPASRLGVGGFDLSKRALLGSTEVQVWKEPSFWSLRRLLRTEVRRIRRPSPEEASHAVDHTFDFSISEEWMNRKAQ